MKTRFQPKNSTMALYAVCTDLLDDDVNAILKK